MRPRSILVIAAIGGAGALACNFSVGGAPTDARQPPGADDASIVVPSDASRDAAIDAASPSPDAPPSLCGAACANAGGTCDEGTCTFTCVGSACEGRVECPPGMPCKVRCVNAGLTAACPKGVDCGDATSCVVECMGGSCFEGVECGDAGACSVSCSTASCAGGVECGDAACDVSCTGASCGSVDCEDSCACSVSCDFGSCGFGVSCPASACSTNNGCRTTPATCNTCP